MSSPLRRHAMLVGAIVRRDLQLAWSYRLQFVAGVFSGVVTLAVFYYVSKLVRVPQFTPAEYFGFVAIGVVIFTIVSATLQLPQAALRQELVAGTFERILLAPNGSAAAIVSLLVYPALYALVTATAMIGLSAALFGLELQWATVPLAIPVAILSLLALSPFGVLLLASIVFSKKAPPGANYVVAALSLVAGLYFPINLLPAWIQWASNVQPLTPAVELMRSTLAGQSLAEPTWLAIAKLIAFGAVAFPLTVYVLGAALRASRARGTILEY